MVLPMRIRHPQARGRSRFVRLAYIPVRSMSGPQRAQMARDPPLPERVDLDQSDSRLYRPARARHAAVVLARQNPSGALATVILPHF